MKRCYALIAAALMLAACGARAQETDSDYVKIYSLIMDGDALANSGQSQEALSKYTQAQTALQLIRTNNPNWNVSVVKFRLEYLSGKIAALSTRIDSESAARTTATVPAPAGASGVSNSVPAMSSQALVPAVPAAPSDWEEQISDLKGSVRQLQSELSRLQTEKGLLEAKLREAFAAQPPAVDPAEMAKARQQVKLLERRKDLLEVTLEQQRAKVPSAKAPQTTPERALAEASSQLAQQKQLVSQLSMERDALQAQINSLTAGTNPFVAPEAAMPGSRTAELESQLSALRAQIEVLEARAVPYAPEEVAALSKPEVKPAQPEAKGRSIQELTPEAAKLAVEARGYFLAGQFDKAEAAYLEVVRLNGTNASVFANLAAIQLERSRFDAAETSVKQALAASAEDPYSLFVLGSLRFRQGKYDEALQALSRAAKVDPQNAEVQNYLGLTLSEKGQRAAAESALRRAVELDPNYASAQNNLAVVYITQEPPAVELARLHYQKALAAGAQRNPELEKLLEEKSKAFPQQK